MGTSQPGERLPGTQVGLLRKTWSRSPVAGRALGAHLTAPPWVSMPALESESCGREADTSFPFLPAVPGEGSVQGTLPWGWGTSSQTGSGSHWGWRGRGVGAHVGCRRVQGLNPTRALRLLPNTGGQAALRACQLLAPVSHRSLGHRVRGVLGQPRCRPTRGPSEELASFAAHSGGAGTLSRSLIPLTNNC